MTPTNVDIAEDYTVTTDLPAGERYELLESDRRRIALRVLERRRSPVELSTVAEAVASSEEGVDARDDEAVSHVAVSLHHRHLPKMDDLGVIDYDPRSNRVIETW